MSSSFREVHDVDLVINTEVSVDNRAVFFSKKPGLRNRLIVLGFWGFGGSGFRGDFTATRPRVTLLASPP